MLANVFCNHNCVEVARAGWRFLGFRLEFRLSRYLDFKQYVFLILANKTLSSKEIERPLLSRLNFLIRRIRGPGHSSRELISFGIISLFHLQTAG